MDSRDTEDHPRPVRAAEIVEAARAWIGTPYRHQGRGPSALDCVGLILVVCAKLGLLREVTRTDYGRLPTLELIDTARRLCIPVEGAEVGCLVLIRWPGDPAPGHGALCTGRNLIHAYGSAGRVVEHGFRGHWRTWADSFYRFPGVTPEPEAA